MDDVMVGVKDHRNARRPADRKNVFGSVGVFVVFECQPGLDIFWQSENRFHQTFRLPAAPAVDIHKRPGGAGHSHPIEHPGVRHKNRDAVLNDFGPVRVQHDELFRVQSEPNPQFPRPVPDRPQRGLKLGENALPMLRIRERKQGRTHTVETDAVLGAKFQGQT